MKAVEAMTGKDVVLIAGGVDKGSSYAAVEEEFCG
jgi:UDP-N-acetylmuramoylalanine-D-glutamate ligase